MSAACLILIFLEFHEWSSRKSLEGAKQLLIGQIKKSEKTLPKKPFYAPLKTRRGPLSFWSIEEILSFSCLRRFTNCASCCLLISRVEEKLLIFKKL